MKILSWNIQWARGVDGRVDLGRIVEETRRLGEPEVLLLQEVAAGYRDGELPGADGSDQFAGLGALLPGYRVVAGAASEVVAADGRRLRFGNVVATRLPLLRVLRHALPWPPDPTVKSMPRLALEATLQAPFGPLRVTSTHLEYYSPLQREAQAARLRELHAEAWAQARQARPGRSEDGPFDAVPRAGPCVLGGDFNCTPGSPAWRRLLAPFDDGTPALLDSWAHCHPGQPHAPTVGLHDPVQWPQGPRSFDALLVSADLGPRLRALQVDAASLASDHQPVVLTLDDAPAAPAQNG